MDTLRTARRIVLAAAALAALAGCQFPAIDPSGQRIFSGGTTGLAHHGGLFHHHRNQPAVPVAVAPAAVVPAPAVPVVPTPVVPVVPVVPVKPPCTPPPIAMVQPPAIAAPPVIAAPPPVIGQIQPTPLPPKLQITDPACADGSAADQGPVLTITPSRLVAPIGTEVLLAAGICDGRGYCVLRQPLEWMLAQDGVGQIMAVGKESPLGTSYVLRHSPQKVATNYVRAHTSTIEQTVDRGTPNPADDVLLRQGQSFITVSSPTEGTSHITVWAPKEHNWERRQATATIYWVDARWQFPPPASSRPGQKQTLTTVVTRSGGAPVAGWIVRYEVLGGPEAVFTARGDRALEVRTDAAGRATVELLPRTQEPGITSVGVQVIRPATGRGDVPQMVVGQGQTSVNWSTPGLAVSALGPSVVAEDGAVSYRVEVVNNGDLPSRGVTLSYTPPTGVTLLNSTPPAQAFGQRYQWRLGDLAPRSAVQIEINCRAAVAADIHSVFRAQSGESLSAEGRATTRVFANALSVEMTGPESIDVGREARFLVDITNTGSAPLTGVVASDTFDPGLSFVGGGASPIRKAIEKPIEPGQTEKIALAFLVTQPGRHAHRLSVTADGGHTATARGVVTGIAAASPAATPARLSVRVTGPRSRQVGEVAEYFIDVTNTGGAAARNVRIDVQYAASLQFDRASGLGRTDDLPRRRTQWQVAEIPVGQTVRKQLNCRCAAADEAGAIVEVTAAADGLADSPAAEARTLIAAALGSPPPMAPAAGSLQVTVSDLADPIMIGGKTTYVVTLTNERTVADQDVAVTLEASAGLEIAGSSGPTALASRSPDGRTADLTPITELTPGEKVIYRITATGRQAGKHQLQVTAKSRLSSEGTTAQGETTVNMP